MALQALNDQHAAQILAGTLGRDAGHSFESGIATAINALGAEPFRVTPPTGHLSSGVPALELLNYIAAHVGLTEVAKAEAWWFGGLATSGKGHRAIPGTDIVVPRSKSDVFVRLRSADTEILTGVGIKTCNKDSPTNAQLFFTTAQAFCDLLESRVSAVAPHAREALRMFCGDEGFRPVDLGARGTASTDRFFWEETPAQAQAFWKGYLTEYQVPVTELLLRFAYADDPVPPDFLMHQRVKPMDPLEVPIALYSIEEFLAINVAAGPFSTKPYRVLKGSARNPDIVHEAPRFGYVQFQRGGQRQHPTQLQFNLKAGYFNDHAAPTA